MLRELGPLLAEEGIDINADVPDMDVLQNALNRAVERRNMALFTPVGQTRELAVTALRLAVQAITDDDTTLAAAVLEQVEPESPDNSAPTVSACIGAALGLLDDWLSGHPPAGPRWARPTNPTTRRALDRRTRRHRHPRAGPQTPGIPVAGHPADQTRRPQRPLRQRPRARRRRADLVTRNRHPSARRHPHHDPLTATISTHQQTTALRRQLESALARRGELRLSQP
jgi:hypothetical protein